MKKFFTLFVLAIFACLNAVAQFAPEEGKQYVIKDAMSSYYIVLAVGNDSQASDTDNTTQASLGVTGTPFTFTAQGTGFTLSTDDGKYLGIGARAWNVGTDSPAVWNIENYEAANGRCHIYLSTTAGKGLGLDNHTIGSGVYTNKPNAYWVLEEYVAPEVTHTVTATLDGVAANMLEDGEGGYLVTFPEIATGDHTVVVSYDGEETSYDFTTSDYKVFEAVVSVGKVTVSYKDGVITVTGDGIGADPIGPTATFKGVVVPSLTSISSLADLEGMQLTFVDAEEVSLLEECAGFYVQNEDGSEVYALWNPDLGGTCEANGNVVTLRNFYVGDSEEGFSEIPAGTEAVYFEDYETFAVSNADEAWDGYFVTFSIAYEGAPAPAPFQLIVKNNGVVCPNGEKVAAAEAGVAVDFYFDNEGLTVANAEAAVVLYKENSPLTFSMTRILADGVSFMGGASQMQEPGTYLLEIPAGTYTDATGNENLAYYGQWVIIEPTGIDSVTLNTSDKVYDLQGRRVVAPAKGLYIVNGVKVVR